MAEAILALQDELTLRPIIAHLHHGLRGADADADAEFVAAFAVAHDTPCVIERADVHALANAQRVSTEVAARTARYHFLAQVATAHGSRHIALAHNADDQAETVLLRLIRGSGMSGLRGIQTVSQWQESPIAPTLTLVRPLLNVPRRVIEEYCAVQQLTPRHDASNDEQRHLRNRVRHELLPLLEQYNAGIRKVLLRLAETASTDMDVVEYATAQAYAALTNGQPEAHLNRSMWRALPVGLQRAVLREAVRRLQGDVQDLKFAGVEEARDVLNSDATHAEIALLAHVRIIVTPHAFWLAKMPETPNIQ
jgi:tRNA(Ile)-lysidine synthetase-like protein